MSRACDLTHSNLSGTSWEPGDGESLDHSEELSFPSTYGRPDGTPAQVKIMD